jgi:hypothetical protein
MYRYTRSNNTLTKASRKMILTPLRDSPVESIFRLGPTANFRKKFFSHFFYATPTLSGDTFRRYHSTVSLELDFWGSICYVAFYTARWPALMQISSSWRQ